MVSRVAWGMSQHTKSTLPSIRLAIKATLRARRSSFAITSVSLCFFQSSSALASSGRSFRLPLSTSTNSPSNCQRAAVQIILNGLALRLDAIASLALLVSADPQVREKLSPHDAVLFDLDLRLINPFRPGVPSDSAPAHIPQLGSRRTAPRADRPHRPLPRHHHPRRLPGNRVLCLSYFRVVKKLGSRVRAQVSVIATMLLFRKS